MKGKIVMPGMIDAHAHRSNFPENGEGGGDINELTNPVTAELNAYYAIDPNNIGFKIACEYGITTNCVIPGSGNVVGGYGIAIKSAGKGLAEQTIANPVALKAAMGINPKGVYNGKNRCPMSRMGIAQTLRDYLTKGQGVYEEKGGPRRAIRRRCRRMIRRWSMAFRSWSIGFRSRCIPISRT